MGEIVAKKKKRNAAAVESDDQAQDLDGLRHLFVAEIRAEHSAKLG
jgi:hypothetical protein